MTGQSLKRYPHAIVAWAPVNGFLSEMRKGTAADLGIHLQDKSETLDSTDSQPKRDMHFSDQI